MADAVMDAINWIVDWIKNADGIGFLSGLPLWKQKETQIWYGGSAIFMVIMMITGSLIMKPIIG